MLPEIVLMENERGRFLQVNSLGPVYPGRVARFQRLVAHEQLRGAAAEEHIGIAVQKHRAAGVAVDEIDGKNRAEHDYVVRLIRSVLERVCYDVDVPATPQIMRLAHHLGVPRGAGVGHEREGNRLGPTARRGSHQALEAGDTPGQMTTTRPPVAVRAVLRRSWARARAMAATLPPGPRRCSAQNASTKSASMGMLHV